jgi:hypothetical protein
VANRALEVSSPVGALDAPLGRSSYNTAGVGGRSMNRVLVWQRLDTVGLEYAEIATDPLRLAGDVVLREGGESCAISYSVECDAEEKTRSAAIRVKREGARKECRLRRSEGDLWTVDGIRVPGLDGLADVDLSITPSTNTPPIRRLRLAVGQRAEVTAAWVRFPELEVVPLRQVYRRTAPHLYEYEAPALDFAAELDCDEDGIVRAYGGLWTRSA